MQIVGDLDVTTLLMEAALHAIREGKSALNVVLNSPWFFPFQFSRVTGEAVAQRAPRIEWVRYGLDDDLIRLK